MGLHRPRRRISYSSSPSSQSQKCICTILKLVAAAQIIHSVVCLLTTRHAPLNLVWTLGRGQGTLLLLLLLSFW
jgi:hypothetical protein